MVRKSEYLPEAVEEMIQTKIARSFNRAIFLTLYFAQADLLIDRPEPPLHRQTTVFLHKARQRVR
jgi:hypothetical protein